MDKDRNSCSRPQGGARMVKLATLWERTGVKGTRYFSGYLGDAKLVMFADSPAEDGTPRWKLLVQERDPSRRPQARTRGP